MCRINYIQFMDKINPNQYSKLFVLKNLPTVHIPYRAYLHSAIFAAANVEWVIIHILKWF